MKLTSKEVYNINCVLPDGSSFYKFEPLEYIEEIISEVQLNFGKCL